jgi:membrane protein implicated in regulation of membrane protease activity
MTDMNPDALGSTLLALAATGVASSATALLMRGVRRAFKRDEEQERTRLRSDVLGTAVIIQDGVETGEAERAVHDRIRALLADPTQEANAGTETSGEEYTVNNAVGQEPFAMPAVQGTAHQAKFAVLLVDYYAYGLTQARRSFMVSLSFSILGGLVLITGVALAIFHANTNGQAYAAVITSIAGVLTSSIGVLFHQLAARALKHMEEQTNKLRQDMKAEHDASAAIDLLGDVADTKLRGWLQAALILQFTGAELPNIGPLEGTDSSPAVDLNGHPRSKVTNLPKAPADSEPSDA